MPLAIEVAAANALIYTVSELSDRLRRRELPAGLGPQGDLRSMNEAVALGFGLIAAGGDVWLLRQVAQQRITELRNALGE